MKAFMMFIALMYAMQTIAIGAMVRYMPLLKPNLPFIGGLMMGAGIFLAAFAVYTLGYRK